MLMLLKAMCPVERSRPHAGNEAYLDVGCNEAILITDSVHLYPDLWL